MTDEEYNAYVGKYIASRTLSMSKNKYKGKSFKEQVDLFILELKKDETLNNMSEL